MIGVCEPKTENRRLKTDRRGWVVWTWGKMGALFVFTGLMLVFLSSFFYLSTSAAAEEANALARDLGGYILDAYNSQLTTNVERRLPAAVDGRDYELRFLNTDGILGIIVETEADPTSVSGGASVGIPYDSVSAGPALDSDYICITKFEGEIYIEWSRCE